MTNQDAVLYELDPTHTYVGFSVRHMMVTQQRGQFHEVSGRLWLNRQEPEASRVEATIQVGSVDTHLKQRDDHLRSADFFDVERYPTMRFVSTRFEQTAQGLRVHGELSLHGETLPVTLEAEPLSAESKDPFGVIKIGTSATAKISRKAFGLTWNAALETGGVAVGDEIKITLDLQFQRHA